MRWLFHALQLAIAALVGAGSVVFIQDSLKTESLPHSHFAKKESPRPTSTSSPNSTFESQTHSSSASFSLASKVPRPIHVDASSVHLNSRNSSPDEMHSEVAFSQEHERDSKLNHSPHQSHYSLGPLKYRLPSLPYDNLTHRWRGRIPPDEDTMSKSKLMDDWTCILERRRGEPGLYYHSSSTWLPSFFSHQPLSNLKPLIQMDPPPHDHALVLRSGNGAWTVKRVPLLAWTEANPNAPKRWFYKPQFTESYCNHVRVRHEEMSQQPWWDSHCPLMPMFAPYQCDPALQTRNTSWYRVEHWHELFGLVDIQESHVDVLVARDVHVFSQGFYKQCPWKRHGSRFAWSDMCGHPRPGYKLHRLSSNESVAGEEQGAGEERARREWAGAMRASLVLDARRQPSPEAPRYQQVFSIAQSWGFPHFMMEVLPKLILFADEFRLNPNLTLHTQIGNMFQHMFDLLGIPESRVVHNQVVAKELWAPAATPCCCIRGLQSYLAAQRLRTLALTRLQRDPVAFETISKPYCQKHILLLWRPDRGFLINWVALHQAVVDSFPDERIEVFNATLHSHDLDATMMLFAGAKLVMGAQGGGFNNMMFCAPATGIIEFRAADAKASPHFVYLATNLGMRFYGFEMAGWNVPVQQATEVVQMFTCKDQLAALDE